MLRMALKQQHQQQKTMPIHPPKNKSLPPVPPTPALLPIIYSFTATSTYYASKNTKSPSLNSPPAPNPTAAPPYPDTKVSGVAPPIKSPVGSMV
mmetsp:Transcript_3963/g.6864  ORF Transcript_3963/g.6864 Transcript_3963/m.6864 type:complete len:94 (+) Transcript_3963:252-533(+)